MTSSISDAPCVFAITAAGVDFKGSLFKVHNGVPFVVGLHFRGSSPQSSARAPRSAQGSSSHEFMEMFSSSEIFLSGSCILTPVSHLFVTCVVIPSHGHRGERNVTDFLKRSMSPGTGSSAATSFTNIDRTF